MPTPWGTPTFQDIERARRQQRLQQERDIYERQIRNENIRNLQLQNEALSSSIRVINTPPPPPPPAPAVNFPSFAEIQSIITSSQQRAQEDFRNQINLFNQAQAEESRRAQEDFRNQINLLQSQWQQKQEEKQVAPPPTQENVIEDLRNRIDLLQSQWQQKQEEKQVAPPPTPPPPTPSNLSPVNDGSSKPPPSTPADNFPSLAEIQSLIESSQQKAQEDFTSKIDLLKAQEQQKQEEEQLSARNAAIRMQNYQRQSAIGAWESALRGR